MKKKLPVLGKPTPAQAQRDLAVKPVTSGTRPEFPTRSELARKAGMIGGATLLAGGLAHAEAPPPPPAKQAPTQSKPAPAPPPAPQRPVNPKEVAEPPVVKAVVATGTVDGNPLAKTAPKFKVYREGGGIGPAEDMWQEEEVEAFINWTMAKEGKLNLKTNYKFEFDGVTFDIDAYDPEKNVGYEYVDKLDYDKDYFTKEVRAKFDAWMKAKKVAVLFIETKKNPDAATIRGKVVKFLNAVKKAGPLAGGATVTAPSAETAPKPPTPKKW